MVLSSSTLNSLLTNKDYSNANKYAQEQLSENFNDVKNLVSSVQKCTNVVSYHLYQLKPTEQETYSQEKNILISTFVLSLEMLTSISSLSNVDGTVINKILGTAHQVIGYRTVNENDIALLANIALKTYEFVDRFISFKSEMANLPSIVRLLSSLVYKPRNNNHLQDVKKLFIPCLLFLQVINEDTRALFKYFNDWKQKTMKSGGKISLDSTMVDLQELGYILPDVLKRNVIKGEMSYYRRNPKHISARRMLIEKLRQLNVSVDQKNCDSIIADIEELWMNYFDNPIKNRTLYEYESLLKDIKALKTSESSILMPILLMWIFLTKRKILEQTIDEHINEKSKLPQKEIVLESRNKNEEDRPGIGHIVSLKKDQQMLWYLQEAHKYFDAFYLRNDNSINCDPYITKKLILDCLNVVAEAFYLMKNYQWHEKALQLLIKYAEKYNSIDTKITAICHLSCNYGSSVILDTIKEADTFEKSLPLNAIKILLMTAWRKYQNGFCSDAYEILSCLLQEALLDDSNTDCPLEYKVLLSEIHLLLLYLMQSHGNPTKSNTGCCNRLHDKPFFRHKGIEITRRGVYQIGVSIVKLTNSISSYLSGTSCSQELSRISLALRTSSISLKTRTLMAHICSWIGLVPEAKLFRKLASDLAHQVTSAIRIAGINLMKAEGYLLCEDTSSCLLELKEVEDILNNVVCSRKKEKRVLKKQANCHPEISTIEIVLRDSKENDHLLGASPVLSRPQLDLPNWLQLPWDDADHTRYIDPLHLAILVYKFFTLHAAILDIAQDVDGTNWMLKKALTVQEILTSKLEHDRNDKPSVYIQDLVQEQFGIQNLIVELKGRNGTYQDCHKTFEKQSELLANAKLTSLYFPATLAMHWEQAILKDQLNDWNYNNCNTLNHSINITPEIITKLEQMIINPSGFRTPASKSSTNSLLHLQENTNHKLLAPVRKLLPSILDKEEVKPLNIISEMNEEYREMESVDTITIKSTAKKKKQLSIKTPSRPSKKSQPHSTGKEKFSVYEDMTDSSPIEKISPIKVNKSTAKKKKQLPIKTPGPSSSNSLLQSTGKEEPSVYEDMTESSPMEKASPMKVDRNLPRSFKKMPHSSIPVPVTTSSSRVTRARKQ